MGDVDSPEALEATIARYNDAWNAHDLEAIGSMHAPDMVFENHTAGERAEGPEALEHIGRIFAAWPDIAFTTRRL
jgi:ketosteroid isomerase-like protein